MTHTCHAIECTKPVKPELLMCFKHWKMVPITLQRDVWKHYRVGQCLDKIVTTDYLRASSAAINAVAEKEGRPGRVVRFEP